MQSALANLRIVSASCFATAPNCPFTSTLDVVGDKWMLVIVKQMLIEGKEGQLLLSSEDTRSQHKNKAIVTARFVNLIAEKGKGIHIIDNRDPRSPQN